MRDIFNFFDKSNDPINFNAIRIGLAGPEKIRDWSHGEVKKPETINYRTFKPEKDGLFCAKIFGPVRNYECLCGKYKRMKHRGIVCEKCGVEVIHSKVRRERLGHITLATHVAHIWFFKSLPSKIGLLLDLTQKDLERVIYCEGYMVIDPGDTPLYMGQVLTETQYQDALDKYGEDGFFSEMGAEAIKELLREIERGPNDEGDGIDCLSNTLRKELIYTTSRIKRKRIVRRLRVIEAFRNSDNKPEWMLLEVIPVIPPDLRPLVPLEGGRFATSDLNDLYRRVINRNNRLKRLQELSAPEIIIRNEKRMLQEAVDALFDNGRRGKLITGSGKRPLKSLSDMLKGKHGRFRQNLLGKRVDYSGRSVIVVGPNLKLHQCGLPKIMALELFKPFIYKRLTEKGYSNTIKSAKKLVEQEKPEVWDALEEITKEHPIILNRAPTLHRLGMQAFEPILVEGKAIQLHPLVCSAFNADFDGDQMAVHIPLSIEAQLEARVLMMSTNNILSPATGKPIMTPTQDIVLGCYYMSRNQPFAFGENMIFSSNQEAISAYNANIVGLHANIKSRINNKLHTTTIGRILLYEILPNVISFNNVNKVMGKQELANLVDKCYRIRGQKETVLLTDRLREIGYKYATKAGISISVGDMIIPKIKIKIIKQCELEIKAIKDQYGDGLITDGERYNKVIDIWSKAAEEIASHTMQNIAQEEFINNYNGNVKIAKSFNPLYIMADSGSRGSYQQLKQLAGMRGLMTKPSGEIIETPITANFREGLTVLQYFISTHGARKGLADTALKTANSGYLTRRLVDVAQDSIINEYDCGTYDGIKITSLLNDNKIVEDIGNKILGRIILEDIINPITNEIIIRSNEEITETIISKIEDNNISKIKIRSVLTCKTKYGICAKCYGRDLSKGHLINVGEAVGVIAAQSIGEPGTQLTMRTFHIGGIASSFVSESSCECKTSGRVVFNNLKTIRYKNNSLIALSKQGFVKILDDNGYEKETHSIVYGSTICVEEHSYIYPQTIIAEWDPFSTPILSDIKGVAFFKDLIKNVTYLENFDETTGISHRIIVENKDRNLKPSITIKYNEISNKKINNLKEKINQEYFLPTGSIIIINDGDKIEQGDIIAKFNREAAKTKDITGGLPRVAELFEARHPKNHAIISELTGTISYEDDIRDKRKIIVTSETGVSKEYLIPRGKHICVRENDSIKIGELLTDGALDLHDILRVLGEEYLAKYLIKEIQEIYHLQGARVNDKHVEIIVRQMLKRVRICDAGDTSFLIDEQVEKEVLKSENERMIKLGQKVAISEPIVLGITEASLATESFISGASFQETTKVLTEAAVSNKIDHLRGLKENVIMGRLIPAGTGFPYYRVINKNNMVQLVEKHLESIPNISKDLFDPS